MYKFEKLSVWQETLKLTRLNYELCKSLPSSEKFVVNDQLRRASISVLLNIAEGSGSESDKEFTRFLHISRKSLFEVVALIKFIEVEYPHIEIKAVIEKTEVVGKLLNGLLRKLKTDSMKTSNS